MFRLVNLIPLSVVVIGVAFKPPPERPLLRTLCLSPTSYLLMRRAAGASHARREISPFDGVVYFIAHDNLHALGGKTRSTMTVKSLGAS